MYKTPILAATPEALAKACQMCCIQETALALTTGAVDTAMHGTSEEEEDNDEESLDPAERRRQRMEAAASRPPIYNTEALHEKLEDISWPSEVLSHYPHFRQMSKLPLQILV